MHIETRGKALIRQLVMVAVLGLLTSGLALVAGTGVAAASAAPGHTIATAGTLTVGPSSSGGGGPVDFWKVHLHGGDRVLFTVRTTTNDGYSFEFYAPGTNDSNFLTAKPFSTGSVANASTAPLRFDLQAPYTGTFVLAVCELVTPCTATYSGNGINPMNPYTFSTVYVDGGISAAKAARETRASASIRAARGLRLGHFEAGGANAADFWRIHLNGGDRVLFTVSTTTNDGYAFELYSPKTNDSNFLTAQPLSTGSVANASMAPLRFDLQAPYTGTFVLAVCELVMPCTATYSGNGINPMNPYTFTTRQAGGRETRTSLRLSARTVTYHHEKRLRIYVAVHGRYGGHPRGKVAIVAGKRWLCTVRLVHGKQHGYCSPRSNTRLRAGRYRVTASYRGNFLASRSRAVGLRVRK